MKQSLLITGATGRLGRHVLVAAQKRGWTVTGVARSGDVDHHCDLTDPIAVRSLINKVRPTAVAHLAALTDVDACQRDPEFAFKINAEAAHHVADACQQAGASLVVTSTDQVYDGPAPHLETATLLRNTYAMSKRAGEMLALTCGAMVFRCNFVGKGTPERPGFTDWLVRSARTRAPLTLFTDTFFSPLHASMLAERILAALAGPRPGLYNCGATDGLSKSAFARALAQCLNLDAAAWRDGLQTDVALGAPRPKDMRMDSTHFAITFAIDQPNMAAVITRCAEDYR